MTNANKKDRKEDMEEKQGLTLSFTQARNIAAVLAALFFAITVYGWSNFGWPITVVFSLLTAFCLYLSIMAQKSKNADKE